MTRALTMKARARKIDEDAGIEPLPYSAKFTPGIYGQWYWCQGVAKRGEQRQIVLAWRQDENSRELLQVRSVEGGWLVSGVEGQLPLYASHVEAMAAADKWWSENHGERS